MSSEYSASDLKVVEFDQHIRRRPMLYFAASQGSPELATRVLAGVLGAALHPAASLAGIHEPVVLVEVTTSMSFNVIDDRASALDPDGSPPHQLCGSLLGSDRWMLAAALALSSRALVEVWQQGRGLRQELTGLRPVAPAVQFAAPPGSGTRAVLELDADYFGPDAALAADLSSLQLHSAECVSHGPGYALVRDHRVAGAPIEIRYE